MNELWANFVKSIHHLVHWVTHVSLTDENYYNYNTNSEHLLVVCGYFYANYFVKCIYIYIVQAPSLY